MKRGLDNSFVHYGIRKEDLDTINLICEKYDIDPDWMKEEVLRQYHARKVDAIEMSDADTEDVINAAIQKIKQN